MRPSLALLFLLLFGSGSAIAQPAADPAAVDVARSQTQEAFDKLKTLAGTWVGPLTSTPTEPPDISRSTVRATGRNRP